MINTQSVSCLPNRGQTMKPSIAGDEQVLRSPRVFRARDSLPRLLQLPELFPLLNRFQQRLPVPAQHLKPVIHSLGVRLVGPMAE
jgi:hypothetical protein